VYYELPPTNNPRSTARRACSGTAAPVPQLQYRNSSTAAFCPATGISKEKPEWRI